MEVLPVKTGKLKAVAVGIAGIGISLLAVGTASAKPVIAGDPNGYPTTDACIHAVQTVPGTPGQEGRECLQGTNEEIRNIVPNPNNFYVVDDVP
ncbi:hypothetical protein [Amycolatopsis sp. CA-230715]|uniref:hypothetical protein n=1 Tax=Amycolatopsis sp. CA-230715 TaxID=2745196 RepID=UPI001C01FB15|nr:hypothetical protein [Amycolatopsis sp. CA-230715]QWF82729.1 hypothetical protein HUW46_06168 [Amycolatopsis sp. CA-230715]